MKTLVLTMFTFNGQMIHDCIKSCFELVEFKEEDVHLRGVYKATEEQIEKVLSTLDTNDLVGYKNVN